MGGMRDMNTERLPPHWLKDEKPPYAFCESVTGADYVNRVAQGWVYVSIGRWHIRRLSEKGLKLGGGIDTPTLCKRVDNPPWERSISWSPTHRSPCCRKLSMAEIKIDFFGDVRRDSEASLTRFGVTLPAGADFQLALIECFHLQSRLIWPRPRRVIWLASASPPSHRGESRREGPRTGRAACCGAPLTTTTSSGRGSVPGVGSYDPRRQRFARRTKTRGFEPARETPRGPFRADLRTEGRCGPGSSRRAVRAKWASFAYASIMSKDFTAREVAALRGALHFLHRRCGTWATLGRALKFNGGTLRNVANGHRNATATIVLRVAKLAGVGFDDLCAGRFPAPGTCPHCGAMKDGEIKNGVSAHDAQA